MNTLMLKIDQLRSDLILDAPQNEFLLLSIVHPGSCPKLERSSHGNITQFYPCRIFNVRLNFTVVPVPFERPKVFTSLYWEFPRGKFKQVTKKNIYRGASLIFHVDIREGYIT